MRSMRLRRLCSALPACILFLASPRKSSQKEGDRQVDAGLRPVPCATRLAGRLAKLAFGSDRRQPTAPGQPALLGVSKAAINPPRFSTVFRVHRRSWCVGGFSFPLRGAEQRRGDGGFRLALSEPRSGEFSQPPGAPSSARHRAQRGADPGVAFFLATFSWRSKKKYARASGAEPNAKSIHRTQNHPAHTPCPT